MESYLIMIALCEAMLGGVLSLSKKDESLAGVAFIGIFGKLIMMGITIWAAFSADTWWHPLLAYLAGTFLMVFIPPFRIIEILCSIILPFLIAATAYMVYNL